MITLATAARNEVHFHQLHKVITKEAFMPADTIIKSYHKRFVTHIHLSFMIIIDYIIHMIVQIGSDQD